MIKPLVTQALQDLMDGDFLTAILRPITQVFGSSYDVSGGFTYAILFGITFGMIMLKTQTAIMPAVVFISIMPVVLFVLPPQATPVFYAFLALAITGTVFKVWSQRSN